jgi:hypothetical protein
MYDVWKLHFIANGCVRAYPVNSDYQVVSSSKTKTEESLSNVLNMICSNENCRIVSVVFDPLERSMGPVLLVITEKEKECSSPDERLKKAQLPADRNRGGKRPSGEYSAPGWVSNL